MFIDIVSLVSPLSGKDAVIAVIDRDGFREMPSNEYAYYYENMIDSLSKSISDLSNNGKTKEIVKKMLSVNETTIL